MIIVESIRFSDSAEQYIQELARNHISLAIDKGFTEDELKLLRRAVNETSGWTRDSLQNCVEVIERLIEIADERKQNIRGVLGTEPTPLILRPEMMAETIEQAMELAHARLSRLRDMLAFAASQLRPVPKFDDEDYREEDSYFHLQR